MFYRNFENATDFSFTGGTPDSLHYVEGGSNNDFSSYTINSIYDLDGGKFASLSQNEKN